MFRSSSDHLQGVHIKQAYIKKEKGKKERKKKERENERKKERNLFNVKSLRMVQRRSNYIRVLVDYKF